MIEYHKIILSKVSFNANLFEKELKKAIRNVIGAEVTELKNWCLYNFPQYPGIILKCFSSNISIISMDDDYHFEKTLSVSESDILPQE